MKKILGLINRLIWAIYKLSPQGKKAWKLKKGLEGMKKSRLLRNVAKMNVVHSANKELEEKKILAFHKGESIVKAKKSNHQVREAVAHKHAGELQERGIKITKTGKFKNA